MYPNIPYEGPKPGMFQTIIEAIFFVITFILLQAVFTFIVIGILTIGGAN